MEGWRRYVAVWGGGVERFKEKEEEESCHELHITVRCSVFIWAGLGWAAGLAAGSLVVVGVCWPEA